MKNRIIETPATADDEFREPFPAEGFVTSDPPLWHFFVKVAALGVVMGIVTWVIRYFCF